MDHLAKRPHDSKPSIGSSIRRKHFAPYMPRLRLLKEPITAAGQELRQSGNSALNARIWFRITATCASGKRITLRRALQTHVFMARLVRNARRKQSTRILRMAADQQRPHLSNIPGKTPKHPLVATQGHSH